MKSINQYIQEKLIVNKNTRSRRIDYNCFPKTRKELEDIIYARIAVAGPNCDLNDIDTSKITDMSGLFDVETVGHVVEDFNGDISKWDVSNVKNMSAMFASCKKFNCNLSEWDVSNVEKMEGMFYECYEFEGNGLDNWNTEKLVDINSMFYDCKKFNCNISNWNVSKISHIGYSFFKATSFDQNLSRWILKSVDTSKFDDTYIPNVCFYKTKIQNNSKKLPRFN